METPFNFEKNRRDGKQSNYIKGKNKVENVKYAKESTENRDQDIAVLLEAAIDKIGDTRPPQPEEQYADSDPLTMHRYYLLELLKNTSELKNEGIENIHPHRKQQIKQILQTIIAGDDIWHRGEFTSIETDSMATNRKPLGSVAELVMRMKSQFHQDFLTEVSTLDLLPKNITINNDGSILRADIELDHGLVEESVKFEEMFPEASTFRLSYRYNPSKDSSHSLFLIGLNADEKEVEKVRMDFSEPME